MRRYPIGDSKVSAWFSEDVEMNKRKLKAMGKRDLISLLSHVLTHQKLSDIDKEILLDFLKYKV
jgi:hypothetical protein